MNEIDVFSGMDIYLLDQLMKGSIDKRMKILDAGCGEGRNLVYFLRNDFNVDGIDPKEDCIQRLKERFPERKESFHRTSVESFVTAKSYDFIISNAVLHFVKSADEFKLQFKALVDLLNPDGLLFIRTLCSIGIDSELCKNIKQRFIASPEMIFSLCQEFNLEIMGDLKSTVVYGKRSMGTFVLKKRN